MEHHYEHHHEPKSTSHTQKCFGQENQYHKKQSLVFADTRFQTEDYIERLKTCSQKQAKEFCETEHAKRQQMNFQVPECIETII